MEKTGLYDGCEKKFENIGGVAGGAEVDLISM